MRIGGQHSEETKKKISIALKGRTFSPETIEQMRLSHTGKPRKPHTEESKKKISEALTGRTLTPEHRENMRKGQAAYRERRIRQQDKGLE